ncbi:MAG TPA: hypothetical protein VGE45_01095 [Chloroflexia bacterium]|jgi:hypothetical protein
MTIKELLDLANEGYPDHYLSSIYGKDGKIALPLNRLKLGDTLAYFVVSEIIDGYNPDATDAQQIDTAKHGLYVARDQLEATADALWEGYIKMLRAKALPEKVAV